MRSRQCHFLRGKGEIYCDEKLYLLEFTANFLCNGPEFDSNGPEFDPSIRRHSGI